MKARVFNGRALAGLTLVSSLLAASPALAQAPRKGDKPAAPAKDEKLAEAKAHYEAGLRLYDAEDYDAARVEFERAYSISPNYRILYNLGLILKFKTDYVGALKNFELYLEEGVDAPEARRQEVQKETAQLRQLVATLEVTTNVPDAEILIDDVPVAKTPIAKPILINPGRRRISATKKGRLPAAKAVDVAARDKVRLALELGEEKQIIVVTTPTRRLPWVGYAVTGALAAAAGVTGYVGWNASSSLSDELALPNRDPERLKTLGDRTDTFALISDIATGGAIIAGGISLYLTIKWIREDNAKEKAAPPAGVPPKAAWLVTPGGVAGTF